MTVGEKLGDGGFATVYACRDAASGEQFALKRMAFGGNEDALDLAKREAATMERLGDHPHIVKLVAHELPTSARGEGYLLLEKCGSSLNSLLEGRGGRLDDALALSVFSEISSAVCHSHAAVPPVAHRDLKVENVLRGADGKWKLCDFGSATERARVYDNESARLSEEEIIQKQTTPAYRPPEMWDLFRRQRVDEKVDVWAMGCLLFRLVYGTLAFDGESSLQVLNGNYRVPAGLDPMPDGNVLKLIRAALTADPAARPTMARLHQATANVGASLGAAATQLYPPPPPKPIAPGGQQAGFAQWDAFGEGGGAAASSGSGGGSKAAFWDAVGGNDGDCQGGAAVASSGAAAGGAAAAAPAVDGGFDASFDSAPATASPAVEGGFDQSLGSAPSTADAAPTSADRAPDSADSLVEALAADGAEIDRSCSQAGSMSSLASPRNGSLVESDTQPTSLEAELATARAHIAELEATVAAQAAELEALRAASADFATAGTADAPAAVVAEDPFALTASAPVPPSPAAASAAAAATQAGGHRRTPSQGAITAGIADPFATLSF